MTLLAVWAACGAHCAFETLKATERQACCDEDAGQSNPVPDAPKHCACTAIQGGGYVSQENGFSVPLPLNGICLFVLTVQHDEAVTDPGNAEPAPSPPRTLEPWQFVLRAAQLARAPSFIS